MVTALLMEETAGGLRTAVRELADEALPAGEVTVAVAWTTLNYKDGMILQGLGRLVRQYPHVPGINLAGTVIASRHPDYRSGDQVIGGGHRLGETHWGGYATRAAVLAEHLVPLPPELTPRAAMALGTAGFAAMLALDELEAHGLTPVRGEVLVTGAAGGVGSLAVALLAHLGYRVVAGTGRPELVPWLRRLGAADVMDRAILAAPPERPLGTQRWAAVIDNVGGSTLAQALAQLQAGGSVAAVGLAGAATVTTSLLPLLLRGVRLLGIDGVTCPPDRRRRLWARLARQFPRQHLDTIAHEAALADLPALAPAILAGQVRGRLVVPLPPG